MTQVRFISNESEADQLEGVYVKEETPVPSITGAQLNDVGFAGVAVRGPINKAIDISSGRVTEVFGGRDYGSGGDYVNELHKAGLGLRFGTVYGVRVAAASASKATATAYDSGTEICEVRAAYVGQDGNNVEPEVMPASDGTATKFNLRLTRNGKSALAKNINFDGTNDNWATVKAQTWPDSDLAWVDVIKTAAGRPDDGALTMAGGGDGAVTTPSAPTLSVQGTPAGTTYTYKTVCKTSSGIETAASAAATTATGAAALNGTDFVRVTPAAVPAGTYEVDFYRTVGGATQGLIGTVRVGQTPFRLDDTGLVADGSTAPAVNSTADLAASDYTGSGKAMEVLAAKKQADILAVVGASAAHNQAICDKWDALIATGDLPAKTIVIGEDDETVSPADAVTAADDHRSEQIRIAFGHYYTTDFETGDRILVSPVSLMCSILSQSDADQHLGREATKTITAGAVRELYWNALTRSDYIAFKAAGICALEDDEGVSFVSGVTSSLAEGKDQDTRRRSADAILVALATSLKWMVKEVNTTTLRTGVQRVIKNYLDGLKRQERIVEDFSVSVPHPSEDKPRQQVIDLRVDLLNHVEALLFRALIGESVTIEEVEG